MITDSEKTDYSDYCTLVDATCPFIQKGGDGEMLVCSSVTWRLHAIVINLSY